MSYARNPTLYLSGMGDSTLSPFFVVAGVAAAAVGLGYAASRMRGGTLAMNGKRKRKNRRR